MDYRLNVKCRTKKKKKQHPPPKNTSNINVWFIACQSDYGHFVVPYYKWKHLYLERIRIYKRSNYFGIGSNTQVNNN